MNQNRVKLLFAASALGIIVVYIGIFGEVKTIQIIFEEFMFILLVIPLFFFSLFYKKKLKGYAIIDFNANSNLTLKNTILLFLFFQVIDYIYEDGLKGMISQWFAYWIMGIIALVVLDIINTYKNLKLIKLQVSQQNL